MYVHTVYIVYEREREGDRRRARESEGGRGCLCNKHSWPAPGLNFAQ